MPNQQIFRPNTSRIFLEIHPGFLRKILFVLGQNPLPLCIPPFSNGA